MGLLVAALVLAATPVLAGLLLVRADQGGTLGPLLTVPGLVAALAITGQLAQSAGSSHPWGAAYVTAASQGAWVLIYVAVAVLVLFFPDGRLSGRCDRYLLAAIVRSPRCSSPWRPLRPDRSCRRISLRHMCSARCPPCSRTC